MKKRISSSCDACAFRRVKCDPERPCRECKLRGLECTSLRTRGKRGPKGPRPATCRKIQEGLSRLVQNGEAPTPPAISGSSPESAASHELCAPLDFLRPTAHRRLPIESYCKYLRLFRDRLSPVWPVVSIDDLMAKIISDANDYESYALAASVCAAGIAQLRLQEHTDSPDVVISSHHFARDAQSAREQYDYRECHNVSSILVPFFLHIYYANASKIRTSSVCLRESIASLHWLGLDRQETYEQLEPKERSLRLRLFWLLFISERTFCAQNCFPAVLLPIDEMPPYEETDSDSSSITRAFSSLTRLFSHLQSNMLDSSAANRSIMDASKVAIAQADLGAPTVLSAFTEVQRVDLFVTRQWIRILIWEYTMRHFKMSRDPSDQAFSLLLPVTIARELLSLFPSVSAESIYAHGYGMELKVFRVADALMDILACAPGSASQGGSIVGMGDILGSLKTILSGIGGPNSEFLHKLQIRMSNSELAVVRPWSYLSLPVPPETKATSLQQERVEEEGEEDEGLYGIDGDS